MKKHIITSIFSIASLGLAYTQSTNKTTTEKPLEATDTLALVRFRVSDFEDIPETGAVIHIKNTTLKIDITATSDIEGKFNTLLPEGQTFDVTVDKFGKNFNFGKMEIPTNPGAIEFDQVLQIKVVTNYLDTYTLDNVYFDSNKADIKPESINALNLLVDAMKDDVRMKIEIAGHTDDKGDKNWNLKLSQMRADAVKNYLTSRGINPNRIISKGYGQYKPIADNSTPEGRNKNRRTEVKTIERSSQKTLVAPKK